MMSSRTSRLNQSTIEIRAMASIKQPKTNPRKRTLMTTGNSMMHSPARTAPPIPSVTSSGLVNSKMGHHPF